MHQQSAGIRPWHIQCIEDLGRPALRSLQGRHYVIESEIDSFAGRDVVMDVLTDYDNHSSVFSSIQSSQVIDRSENEADVLQVLLCSLHLACTLPAHVTRSLCSAVPVDM